MFFITFGLDGDNPCTDVGMNLGRKDDISPMQGNVVLSDSEGESFLCFFRYRLTPPPSALSQLIRISLRPSSVLQPGI